LRELHRFVLSHLKLVLLKTLPNHPTTTQTQLVQFHSMETQGSSNHGDSRITDLAQEMDNLTPSPLRKKSRQLNDSYIISGQVGSNASTRGAPNQPGLPKGFHFAPSSSLGAIDETSICKSAIRTDNTAPAETNFVTERRHRVKMTLFGAVCFHPGCMTRLGSSIHTVSEKTLRSHFNAKQCYAGRRRPDCTNLVRDLKKDLSALRKLVLTGGPQVDELVERDESQIT